MQSADRSGGNRRSSVLAGTSQEGQSGMFEQLESRVLLYTPAMLDNLPDISLLADPNNTVVRFATDFGTIDIELFDRAGPNGEADDAAPNTAANFLEYVNSGRFDNTFFHRLVRDFVLQGGGFIFDDGQVRDIDTDDPIENEFDDDRPNVERTIAMAKLPGQPDSATSQFFFNLRDNDNLNDSDAPDIQDSGGFTVFGRVIQGWDVVLEIAGLDIVNYSSEDPALGETPVTPAHDPGDPIGNAVLVNIDDAEVIKAAGTSEFYTQAIYFPEGFSSAKIIELLDLANLDTNAETRYQVILRYEGERVRDDVVATGTIAAGARTSVLIADFPENDPGLVRKFRPYAFEVRATGPVSASLNRFDFGAASAETFTNVQPLSAAQLSEWTFGAGRIGDDLHSFLVYQNLSLETANLTIQFWSQTSATPRVFTKALGPLRRGGLNLSQLEGLPEGRFSISITSNQPIVAALSEYESAADVEQAATTNGVVGGPAMEGILAGVRIPSGSSSFLRLQLAPDATTPTMVDFDIIRSDGTVIEGNPRLMAPLTRTQDYNLSQISNQIPQDEFITIRYRVRTGSPITAHYSSTEAEDEVLTPFQTIGTSSASFAGAFLDPARANTTFDEVLSIFNPFDRNDVTLTYRVGFLFADDNDGQSDEILFPAAAQGTLGSLERVDLRVRDLSDILAKIQSGNQFRSFSIVVETTAMQGTTEIGTATVAQLTRIDSLSGDAFTTLGMLGNGTAFLLSDNLFDGNSVT